MWSCCFSAEPSSVNHQTVKSLSTPLACHVSLLVPKLFLFPISCGMPLSNPTFRSDCNTSTSLRNNALSDFQDLVHDFPIFVVFLYLPSLVKGS